MVCILLFSAPYFVFAAPQDFTVNITEESATERFYVLDRGSESSIKNGDIGFLVHKKFHKKDNRYYLIPVLKIQAVRALKKKSVWVKLENFSPKKIRTDLLLFTQTQFLHGRRKLNLGRRKIILKNTTKKDIGMSLQDSHLELSKKEKDYAVARNVHSREEHFDADAIIIDFHKWREKKDASERTAIAVYEGPQAEDFRKKKRISTFEKMMAELINKYNDPSFDYEDFYKEQKNESDFSYENYIVKRREINRSSDNEKERYYADLLSKGESWSGNYSNEELSVLMNSISDIRERDRRKSLVGYKYKYQGFLAFGLNLISNDNLNDNENTSDAKYDFEIGGEGFFFKGVKFMENFTLGASFRRANDSFYTGSLNAVSTEYSMSTELFWYPGLTATVIDSYIFFVGLNLRFGVSTLDVPSTGETGNYQVLSIPGLKAGIKQNFSSSYGLKFSFGLENISVSRIAKSDDAGTLPDTASYLEGKFSIGLTKLF